MTVPDPERLLKHVSPRDTPAGADCFDEHTVALLAEGTMDDAARARTLPHLGRCPRCRAAVASVATALGDPSVARESSSLGDGRRRFRIAIPAVAAAIIALAVLPWRSDNRVPQHRAPTITAAASPVLMSPVGIVARADMLRWSSVTGADRYRTTLFDDAGAVVFETDVADTVVALPDSVQLARGRSYLWKVEARTGWGRWSASALLEFSIR